MTTATLTADPATLREFVIDEIKKRLMQVDISRYLLAAKQLRETIDEDRLREALVIRELSQNYMERVSQLKMNGESDSEELVEAQSIVSILKELWANRVR